MLGLSKLLMARLLKHLWPRNRIGPNSTDSGKKWNKAQPPCRRTWRHLIIRLTGANRHDSISLEPMLKGRIPKPENGATPQNFCLDAAYVWKEDVLAGNGIIPQFRPRGEERRGEERRGEERRGEEKKFIEKDPTFKARQTGQSNSAIHGSHRFRKLLPRYEKTDLSYNALNALTATMMVLNKILVIYR